MDTIHYSASDNLCKKLFTRRQGRSQNAVGVDYGSRSIAYGGLTEKWREGGKAAAARTTACIGAPLSA